MLPARWLLVVFLFAGWACTKPTQPLTLRFADVATDPDAGGEEYSYVRDQEGTLGSAILIEPIAFAVASTRIGKDSNEKPVVFFMLAAPDGERFTAWAGERLGRQIGTLVDDTLYTVATIRSPLPGGGCIFRENGLTPEEARRIAEGLQARTE